MESIVSMGQSGKYDDILSLVKEAQNVFGMDELVVSQMLKFLVQLCRFDLTSHALAIADTMDGIIVNFPHSAAILGDALKTLEELVKSKSLHRQRLIEAKRTAEQTKGLSSRAAVANMATAPLSRVHVRGDGDSISSMSEAPGEALKVRELRTFTDGVSIVSSLSASIDSDGDASGSPGQSDMIHSRHR